MRPIETVIQRLGYSKSEKLYRLSEINECPDISWHDKKILRELAPYAAYIMDNRVVVIFFEGLNETKNADIHKKIWNAQIPVVISDEGSHIQIYNGKSMSLSSGGSIRLRDIVTYDTGQCDEKKDFSYWNISSSLTKAPYTQSLAGKNLNGYLIDNLKFITRELNTGYHLLHANKLMLRVLFIRYLVDRGVNIGFMGMDSNVERSRERLLDIIQNKKDFLSLINYLKGKFNGNLFEMDEDEAAEISDDALSLLHDFLTSREELESGQLLLFPYYDFNIIPIGLISNIYEILLGKEKRANDKAFYTPEYLADYIVNRTVGKYLYRTQACTVLDPSCGSGIFLVKSLQKILERNADPDGFIHDRNKINTLVKENIYGVDCNDEAVDVTIFSLYIALCDYIDPKDSGELKFPLLKGTNILCGDFFDAKKMEIITG